MPGEIWLHHIQKAIILSLASTQTPQRFSQLQPANVPNNTFSYHLKRLIELGYIEHTAKGYVATRKALKLVTYSDESSNKQKTPKLISVLYITDKNARVCLLNRNHKPFQGWYGLPSGLIHQGETLQEAAKRELFEKTAIKQTADLKEIGVLDFRYLQQDTDDLFVHAVAFIYHLEFLGNPSEVDDKQTKYGQLTWSTLTRQHILPEVLTVREMVGKRSFQRISIDYKEPAHMPIIPDKKKL